MKVANQNKGNDVCLSDDEIIYYACQRPTRTNMHTINEHLKHCPYCRLAVASAHNYYVLEKHSDIELNHRLQKSLGKVLQVLQHLPADKSPNICNLPDNEPHDADILILLPTNTNKRSTSVKKKKKRGAKNN